MKKTIKDYELDSKRVIIRCDLNVPMKDNVILDDTRIKASLETINYAINNNAKVIILSHLGKVKTESEKKDNSLLSVSKRLEELLKRKVLFSPDTRSEELTEIVSKLNNGDVLLIENTRYEDIVDNKESSCNMDLASYWASLGDIFINDAYGTCHRAHASNVGVAKLLPNGIGFLVEQEVTKIDEILKEETHPYTVIMGGKKINDKIPLIQNLITKCDYLLIGGGMSFTFLASLGYNVGSSIVDNENISFCKEMLDKYKDKIILPKDFIVATNIDSDDIKTIDIDEFSNEVGFDIGPRTIELFNSILKESKRVIINGPMGVFENDNYIKGTKAIYECLISNNIKTLIGGGDSASSVNKLGFDNQFYHISTGGGATLEYLGGISLPGISVIEDEK